MHTALQLLIKGGSMKETHQTVNLNFPATEMRVRLLNVFKMNCTHSNYIVDIHFFVQIDMFGINLGKFFTLTKIPPKGAKSLT